MPEDEEDHPIGAELDELQTFIGRKTDKIWLGTALNHHAPGILAIEIGDRSGQTFAKLWQRIRTWESRRYLTDGYCVYANYVSPEKHLVLPKILLTRVEGENTRLRHYLARLHRATLCYSKSQEMLRCSVRLLMHYLRFRIIPLAANPLLIQQRHFQYGGSTYCLVFRPGTIAEFTLNAIPQPSSQVVLVNSKIATAN